MRARRLLGAGILAAIALTAAPREADAFCGFYVAPGDSTLVNDASMVALMRNGTRTVMTMSNNYKGPAADFAMVVPVPTVLQKDSVQTLDRALFDRLETLTSPRLVEYWEKDPCDYPCANEAPGTCGYGYGSGSGYGMMGGRSSLVTVEAQFAVGEYQIVILGAKDSDALEKWLLANGYKIPAGASTALAPYVADQQKFFVAKVDIKKVKLDDSGAAQLSPLRISFDSTDFRLPVRLGLLNASGKQDLIVYLLSETTRFDVANYPNVFITTNVEVIDDTRKSFSSFYAALFDATLDKAGGRAVVTEYAWSSGSCDPCPTPALSNAEIASLGGDVIYGAKAVPTAKGGWSVPVSGGMSGSHPMVLTRLHTRYDKATLDQDLVFRAADPVEGGREGDDTGAHVTEAGTNNFQARYAIRHEWTGPIKCKFPLRHQWGGPPKGVKDEAIPATKLASAPRADVKLASFLTEGIPLLDVAAGASDAGISDGAADASTGDASGVDGSDDASIASGGGVPAVPPSSRGCGCDVGASTEGALSLGSLLVATFVMMRRRRRAS